MKRFLKSDVDDELLLCPYCMAPVDCETRGCCGESSAHFEPGYDIKGELYLESEVVLYDDVDTMAEEQKWADEHEKAEKARFKEMFEQKYDKP